MSSLLTNSAALTALQSLNMTQQNLATTQNQISTGLKVASASDNAAYWSIAQSMSSDTGVLGAVNDSIAQSQSILGAATAAINNVITTIQSIQTVLGEAENPSSDSATIATLNTTLQSLGQQLTSAVNSASYSGVNLLDGSQTGALSFVSGYNVSGAGVASFDTISLAAQALTGTGGVASTTVQPNVTNATTIAGIAALVANTYTASYGVDAITTTADSTTVSSKSLSGVTTTTTYSGLDANGNATTIALAGTGGGSLSVSVTTTPAAGLFTQGTTNLTNIVTSTTAAAQQMTDVSAALTAITSYSSIIGSITNTLTNAATFNSALSDNYTTGIGALVDADMNQASTRLQALQTQQQLGVQSLSIANQSSQLILKLFQ
ncbi:flagellin [Methylocapsa sp. S129]|uniref:flagellin n=1 Tax=Methylocapsa sp. S129 TaxID=1641869 RepID=UPI00131BF56E|nr:flagellin [Methylocapsa sp. S129]